MIIVSYPYTSNQIDQIEEEFKSLDLDKEKVEIVDKLTHVEIIESENDFKIDPKDMEIVKKPTNVKLIETE